MIRRNCAEGWVSMLFNSWTFILYILAVLPIYYSLSHRWQNRFLLVASYFFYSMWDWRFCFLLLISTAVDYVAALGIASAGSQNRRRAFLALSLCTNLGILGFFKYFNFFVSSAADLLTGMGFESNVTFLQVVLPVGISFYTLQTLAYTFDVYRGTQKPTRDLLSFAIYVAYFPQLVAGPIERARRLLPQLQRPRLVDSSAIASGLQLIFWGYVKKVGIADSMARYTQAAFDSGEIVSTPALWLCAYGFAIQAYCDFSGYTDIARGVSRLMGIELMQNFKQPLLSPNITEFWRRWHVSFSTWLRDYVYVPLGGNRKGPVRQYVNLILTLVIAGLWHGANWTFVCYGLLNGVLLSIHRFVLRGRSVPAETKPKGAISWAFFILRVVFTLQLFALGLVFLRSPSIGFASDYLIGMVSASPFLWAAGASLEPAFLGQIDALIFYGIYVLMLDAACWWNDRDVPVTAQTPVWLRTLAFGSGFLILTIVREANVEPFYYFQF